MNAEYDQWVRRVHCYQVDDTYRSMERVLTPESVARYEFFTVLPAGTYRTAISIRSYVIPKLTNLQFLLNWCQKTTGHMPLAQ